MTTLRPKHRRFIDQYLVDLNATQAAVRAGYAKGKTARTQGARLMANVGIKAEIARRQQCAAERLEITHDAVLGELAKIGFANVADFMRPDSRGRMQIDLRGVERAKLAGLTGVSIRVGSSRGRNANQVKLTLQKREALVALGQHLGLFTAAPVIALPDPMTDQKRNDTVKMMLNILDDMAHGRLVRVNPPTIDNPQQSKPNGSGNSGR